MRKLAQESLRQSAQESVQESLRESPFNVAILAACSEDWVTSGALAKQVAAEVAMSERRVRDRIAALHPGDQRLVQRPPEDRDVNGRFCRRGGRSGRFRLAVEIQDDEVRPH